MGVDLYEIEPMLQTLAKHLSATIGRMVEELQSVGLEGPAGEALVARIKGKQRDWERVETQLMEVRRETFQTCDETFTGPWPPTDPASLSAQWVALLDDADELPEEYLGEGHFNEGAPLREAWEELDAAMVALNPRDPAQARAILNAAERDWLKAGGDWHWEERILELARAHREPPALVPR